MEDKQKMLERINALIAKAESTEHPEEAKVFMEKAQELLTKYSLTEYDLKFAGAPGETDKVVTIAVQINNPHLLRKAHLIGLISKANNCKVVQGHTWHREKGAKIEVDARLNEMPRTISTEKQSTYYCNMYITGFSRDVDAVTLLYTSFSLQIAKSIKSAVVPSYVNKGTWASHFMLGFANEIYVRLMKARADAQKTVVEDAAAAGVNLLPVLVDRDKQVRTAYDAVWKGALRSVKTRGAQTFTGGYNAGAQAGRNADIGSKRIGGIGALGR